MELKIAEMNAEAIAQARTDARAEARAKVEAVQAQVQAQVTVQAQAQVQGMLGSIIEAVKKSLASGETPTIVFPPIVGTSATHNVSSKKEPLRAQQPLCLFYGPQVVTG